MQKKLKRMEFFKPNVLKNILNLNWTQAKKRFPLLNPFGDADMDGVKNKFDCKPFDRRRQGKWHKGEDVLDDISIGFGTIKEMKTIGDVQKLEEDFLKKKRKE